MVPPTDPERDDPSRAAEARQRRDMGRYLGLGAQFAASVMLLTFGGYWLDGRLGSSPWFLLVGVFLGFAGGLVSIVKKVAPTRKPTEEPPTHRPDR